MAPYSSMKASASSLDCQRVPVPEPQAYPRRGRRPAGTGLLPGQASPQCRARPEEGLIFQAVGFPHNLQDGRPSTVVLPH
jgi:hypothetical protein